MIIGRTAALIIGAALILAGILFGLLSASYHEKGALTHEVSCGAPWFPAFDTAGDAPVCAAITAPRAELGTGLLVLGGAVALLGAASRRTVAA